MNKMEVLKKYFGYDSFREGQEALVDHIVAGKDCLGIMPTGAGKSICYQLPAVLLPGISIVVSPLISLMKDQVGTLNQMGIRSAYLNSSLSFNQYQKALALAREETYKIIYVAPERLASDDFLAFAQEVRIAMVCVDEAHCVSQWGQDFRPNYLRISEFVKTLHKRPIVCAFTATATAVVREDIVKILQMRDPFEIVTGFDRENLYFSVQKPLDKYESLSHYLKDNKAKSGIIYCLSRKLVEEVCSRLLGDGYQATRYHAGLSDEERMRNQDAFIYDEKRIMVATNAFGMGIDKSNVSFVIHYNMPKNMESYYQEAGRAGRDGQAADCILLYGGQDVRLNQFLIEQGNQSEDMPARIQEELRDKDRERLKSMTFYCSINTCLRHYMLRYFGEYGNEYCGNCSNCLSNFELVDVSAVAQLIIRCVKEANERYGINVLIDTLRGSQNAKVLQYRLDQSSLYGALKETNATKIRSIFNHIIVENILQLSDDKYTVVKLGERANAVLQGEVVMMKVIKEVEVQVKAKKIRKTANHSALFEKLREKRAQVASVAKLPPYMIFSDKTLQDMCDKMPQTKEEMLMVSGVGEVKYERYGDAFLKILREA